MTSKIFLSYRREDSAGQAGRLGDRLRNEFGDDCLFMDVDGIPLGDDFVKRLTREVASCDVLLAVIGPRWLNPDDEPGERRLDNPNDFVRVEISAALQRNIPVIPILLDGTTIPEARLLPDDLKAISVRNGLDLSHASFHADLDRLIHQLREMQGFDRIGLTAPDDQPAEHQGDSSGEPRAKFYSRLVARALLLVCFVLGSIAGLNTLLAGGSKAIDQIEHWFGPGIPKIEVIFCAASSILAIVLYVTLIGRLRKLLRWTKAVLVGFLTTWIAIGMAYITITPGSSAFGYYYLLAFYTIATALLLVYFIQPKRST